MPNLNLSPIGESQSRVYNYLIDNVSDTLADKINNGVKISKDNKSLINKKDLNGFMKFASEEARKTVEKGQQYACMDDDTVYGWTISWPNGLYPVILISGACLILNFTYGLYLTLKIDNYTNTVKKILPGISILGIVLITTGLSVTAYYNPEDSYLTMLRSIHAGFCIAGFAANLITLIIFTITLYKRNKTQFLINLVTDLFLIMSAAYVIIEANDINTYCSTSSVAQIYIFNAYNIVITINYFLMKYMPFNSTKQDLNAIQKIVEEDKEDIK